MDIIDTDALPIVTVSRCIDARTPEHQGFINRISNEELHECHPRYPRTAYGEPVEPKDLIHFVFVYANEDCQKFIEFSEWFEEIKSTIKNGDTVKCDNRESEMFPVHHDDNINDICERAIFILPFLSKSFCDDKVLRFFTSEAIGTTRLDQTSAQGSLENILKKQKYDAVRPIHTEPLKERKYTTPPGLRMMKEINYFGKKDLDIVENKVRGIIEESIRRFEERKTAMENALTGTDRILENFEKRFEEKYGPPPMEPCIENSLLEDTNDLSLTQNGYDVQEQQVGNLGMGEHLTLTTDGNTSLTNNTLSDTPRNRQLNYAEALTNGGKTLSQTSKTAEGKTGHLSAEGRNFNDNETCGFIPVDTQFDTSLETDNGSISKIIIQNATQKTVNNQDQNSTDRAFSTDPCIGVKKDSREAVMTNHMSYTGPDIPSAVLDNAAQSKKKENHRVESPMEKGQISEETVINVNICVEVPMSKRTAICTRENRKDVQRNPANSKTRWNDTNLSTQTSESETSWNNLRLTESSSETKSEMMTTKDQKSTDRAFNTDPCIGVKKDSREAVMTNHMSYTGPDIPSAVLDNAAQSKKKKHREESPIEKGQISEMRTTEEHDKKPEESGSETDSFLGSLECAIGYHESVLGLCKNTLKRSGSLDSGYYSNFSHIYKTYPTPQQGDEQDKDNVD